MKHLKKIFVMMFAVMLILICCDNDNGTGSIDDLIGSWELEELKVDYSGIPADLIEFLGLDITLTVRENKSYTLSTTKDSTTQVENGEWIADNETITINPENGDPKTMKYSIDGNHATLKTTLPNVVDPEDEDLMSDIPPDMFNEDGSLKETPVTLIYIKIE